LFQGSTRIPPPKKFNIAPAKLTFQKLFSGAKLLIFGGLSPGVSGQGHIVSGSILLMEGIWLTTWDAKKPCKWDVHYFSLNC